MTPVSWQAVWALLPQTQCTRCGFPDCEAYARAIAQDEAPINQCPPGGHLGIERLSALTGRPVVPLNPAHGQESPRSVAWVDETWCIGCTLCIKACPVDCILGAPKVMHVVMEDLCTGCELCIPACPVDCIHLEPVGAATGWQAWSPQLATQAQTRYAQRQQRQARLRQENDQRLARKAQDKLDDLAQVSRHTDPAVLEQKKAVIQAALERARSRQPSSS